MSDQKSLFPSTTQSTSVGESVDTVTLAIDYEIIEHFSQNLYGSPNKAIEELVANGFDAFATWVYIFLENEYTPERIVVWDNGSSMDVLGLKALWKIANSPKRNMPDRTLNGPSGQRKMIGKFGIGKLASYTVGRAITHFCRRNDDFLLVNIDYSLISKSLEKESFEDGDTDRPRVYKSAIKRLTELEAREFVFSNFAKRPDNLEALFSEPSWTFGLITHLKNHDLTGGRLRWVLGNAMPLRPDFKVWVDMQSVVPKLARAGAVMVWHMGSPETKEALTKAWDLGVKQGKMSGLLTFGQEKGLDPSAPERDVEYVDFPNLGRVWGEVRLYGDSLEASRSAEQGRSSGFFIMVRGRLINADDDKLFLNEPSFGTFYRSQYILNIDGLDADLLADRERLSQSSIRISEFTLLQKAVYLITRTKQEALDEETILAASPAQRLPTFSREHFLEPLTALLLRQNVSDSGQPFDLKSPVIERSGLGKNGPMAIVSSNGRGFEVNREHPYFKALEHILGGGKKSADVLREYDTLAISEQLFRGHLYDIGLPDERVEEIVEWRDKMYRMLARSSRTSREQLALNLTEASFKGKVEFENAIVEVLEAMGFKAERDGLSGKKDVLLNAPCGQASYSLTFEAKGKSQGAVPNDNAEISGAEAHRQAAGADHAIVIARKFAGFTSNRSDPASVPAVLDECQCIGTVSVMETDALINLLHVMGQFHYPLDLVREVFTTIETPEEKLKRIEKLNHPLEAFDYLGLLDAIWEKQGRLTNGQPVPYGTIYFERYQKKFTEEEIDQKLNALYVIASPHIVLDSQRQRVALRQAPAKIVERVEAVLNPTSVESLF